MVESFLAKEKISHAHERRRKGKREERLRRALCWGEKRGKHTMLRREVCVERERRSENDFQGE